MRKVSGGLKALNTWVEQSKDGKFLIGDSLTLADIAAVSFLGWFSIRWTDWKWQDDYPKLEAYWKALEERESFANTRPSPQTIKDKIV